MSVAGIWSLFPLLFHAAGESEHEAVCLDDGDVC